MGELDWGTNHLVLETGEDDGNSDDDDNDAGKLLWNARTCALVLCPDHTSICEGFDLRECSGELKLKSTVLCYV